VSLICINIIGKLGVVSACGPADPTDDSLAIHNGSLPFLTPYKNIKLKRRK